MTKARTKSAAKAPAKAKAKTVKSSKAAVKTKGSAKPKPVAKVKVPSGKTQTVKTPAKAVAKPAKGAAPKKKTETRPVKAPAAKTPAVKVPATKTPASKAASPKTPASKLQVTKPEMTKSASMKSAARKVAESKAAPVKYTGKPMAVSAPPSRPLPQPVKPALPEPKPAPQSNKVVPLKPAQAKVKVDFTAGDHVVYPTHGVGKILRIERQMIAGFELDLMVVEFERDKMTVRIPLSKVNSVGIRKLSSPQKMKSALETLKGRARVKRAMWSRRAQEYEAKINSGDPVSIAEVVRDLHRNAGQPDQSYSERQIYESALDRLVRELAAVERIDEDSATKKLEKILKVA